MWATTQRPEILIADQGRLIGELSNEAVPLAKKRAKDLLQMFGWKTMASN